MSRKFLFVFLLVSILAACSAAPAATQVDISQVQTDAVATYQAGLPQSTAIVLPTLKPTTGNPDTPVPATATSTATLQPTPTRYIPVPSSDEIQYYAGDHASYSSQTPGDWPILKPAQMIPVSWTFLNDGSTTWDSGYTVRWVGGRQVWGNTEVKLMRVVEPGETGSAAINLYAPETKGNYITYWALFNPDGKQLYRVYFAFVVK